MTTAANPSTTVTAEETEPREGATAQSKKGRIRLIAMGALGVAALGVVAWYMAHAGLEDTDDAQVDADVVSVPAQIGGPVQKVLFVENQHVKAGEVLVELDPAQPKARLEQAEAPLGRDQ